MTQLAEFREHLEQEEKSVLTAEKYTRDVAKQPPTLKSGDTATWAAGVWTISESEE